MQGDTLKRQARNHEAMGRYIKKRQGSTVTSGICQFMEIATIVWLCFIWPIRNLKTCGFVLFNLFFKTSRQNLLLKSVGETAVMFYLP
jgi:hypothetical protein